MFNRYRIFIWDDEKILEMKSGDGGTKMCMYLCHRIIQLKSENGKFYVMHITQLKILNQDKNVILLMEVSHLK